jgi:hypothetical protein
LREPLHQNVDGVSTFQLDHGSEVRLNQNPTTGSNAKSDSFDSDSLEGFSSSDFLNSDKEEESHGALGIHDTSTDSFHKDTLIMKLSEAME